MNVGGTYAVGISTTDSGRAEAATKTAAQMDEAARQVIKPDQFVWVVVGDAPVVRPQLEALGLSLEVRPAAQ